jgi:hypothetical protein
MLSTFLPSAMMVLGCLKARWPTVIVSTSAAASVKNGSQRGPAKTRRSSGSSPFSSFTVKDTVPPVEATQRPSSTDSACPPGLTGGENVQSMVTSCVVAAPA